MTPIIDCLKKEGPVTAAKAFKEIKQKMTKALVLRLSNFFKVFEVMCHVSGIDIGGVLSQESTSLSFLV